MKNTNVLLAGATGYLGSFILKELIERKNHVVAIVRNPDRIENDHENYLEIKTAEVTKPETLRDICKGIDTVISTIGITRQKDGCLRGCLGGLLGGPTRPARVGRAA